jgi:hypothetical protein
MHENEKLICEKLPFGGKEENPQTNLTQINKDFVNLEEELKLLKPLFLSAITQHQISHNQTV